MDANYDRIPSVTKPCDLFYVLNNERIPLPKWSSSFLEVGQWLTTIESTVGRVVIALAVPTRAFASGLIATGIVIANSTKHLDSLAREQYLKYISSLEPGTSVVYRDSKKEFRGKVCRYFYFDGEQFIEIKIGIKEKKAFRLRDHAAYITVSERGFKFRNYQNGKPVKTPGKFLKSLLGDTCARDLISRTEFECLIVGQLSAIKSEVIETKICLKNNCINDSVSLQEILRIRQFLNLDQSYRCSIIPSSYSDTDSKIEDLHPPLVIYDSAYAFIKHNHNWPSAHCVVILDRTERSFTDAAVLLNQNYINRIESKQFEFSPVLPDAIEAMIFQERY